MSEIEHKFPFPEQFHGLMSHAIAEVRKVLEEGGEVGTRMVIGNSTRRELCEVAIDASTIATKEQAAAMLRQIAFQMDADFALFISEAYGLPRDKVAQLDEILATYGAISASPFALDIIAFALETPAGVWQADVSAVAVPQQPMRTLGVVEFTFTSGLAGRFANILPAPPGMRH